MDILKKSKSSLKAYKIIVENMSFERSFEEISSGELESSFIRNVEQQEKDKYKVTLSLAISNKDNTLKIDITVAGLFGFEGEEEFKKDLIERNSVSILFPYIRSQVTLLTAQPGMQPIVIPPININSLLENMNNSIK